MNQRIQELLIEAHKQTDGGIYNGHLSVWTEKFAQLIVRECIEQLVMEGDDWEQFSRNPPEGQENNASAALFAAYRLKEDAVSRLEEHFGVEE
jgi:hypothetical protein